MISEAMERLVQTVDLSCTETNSISECTKTRFYITHVDEDTTSTSTPAAPQVPLVTPPPQAPTVDHPVGPITRARARELNFIMLLRYEDPAE
jgi:hypothetical protein